MIDVREKPKMVERAFLVGIRTPEESAEQASHLLTELKELVETLRIGIEGSEIVRIREPKATPATPGPPTTPSPRRRGRPRRA